MKISRTIGYQFSLQEYESIKVNASATVESGDIGVSGGELLKMSETQMDEHIKALEEFCDEMLQRQLAPLLEEAEQLSKPKSAAHDAYDYHKGQRGA